MNPVHPQGVSNFNPTNEIDLITYHDLAARFESYLEASNSNASSAQKFIGGQPFIDVRRGGRSDNKRSDTVKSLSLLDIIFQASLY